PLLSPLFFFYRSPHHRSLHSFPTRRSSDLTQAALASCLASGEPVEHRRPVPRALSLESRAVCGRRAATLADVGAVLEHEHRFASASDRMPPAGLEPAT